MSKSYGKTGVAPILQLGKFGPQWQGVLPAGLIQALAPPGTGGLCRVQGADSVDDDDFVTRRQLLAAGGGATEPVTFPALVNPPSPINPAFGQRAIVEDTGGFGVTFNLPSMTPAEALGGKRCSLVLPLGNPNQAVTVNAAAGQVFIDPVSGSQVSSVTYSTGTFGGYVDLTWEAAPGAIPALAGTILPPLVPAQYSGPTPNLAPVSVTINGTGGTLPSALNTQVTMSGSGIGPFNLTVNTATQPGGPGTAWTITADIPPGALTSPFGVLDVEVSDTSTFPSPTLFAKLLSAFGVNQAPSPTAAPTDLWVFDEGDPSSGGTRWDESLAAGPNTNGNSAYVTLEDQIVFSSAAPPLADPTQPPSGGPIPGAPDPNFHPKSARSGTVPANAAGGFVALGSAIHTFTGITASGPGNTLWMRWVGQYKQATPGPVRLAVLEEIWAYEFGVWTKLETVTASTWSSVFRFQGAGASIFIEAVQDAVNNYNARGVVEWSWTDGFPAS